jgi:hypothetical protein
MKRHPRAERWDHVGAGWDGGSTLTESGKCVPCFVDANQDLEFGVKFMFLAGEFASESCQVIISIINRISIVVVFLLTS